MAVPPLIEIEEFLRPISPDRPSGEDLRWGAEYEQIQAARTQGVQAGGHGTEERGQDASRWAEVISLGLTVLRERSKDLRIAAFVAEALARRHGLAGLRDGIRLLQALQERFWETAHPRPEGGDLGWREGLYQWLDSGPRLPAIVRSVPVTDAEGQLPYLFLRYQVMREVEDLRSGRPGRIEAAGAQGADPDEFYRSVAATEAAFYGELDTLIGECVEVIAQFNAAIIAEDRFGPGGPTLVATLEALEEVASLVRHLLVLKPGRIRDTGVTPGPAAAESVGYSRQGPHAEGFDGRIYTVWYGTNRRPIDPDDPSRGYSGERERDGRVHHGACWVAVPRSHRFGSVGSSWWKRWLTLRNDRLRVAGRLVLEAAEFWEEVRATLSGCRVGERQALVYLHGYNVSFDEAAIRAAQIGFDLKVPGLTAFFSWPSRGTFDGYPADEASIEASAGPIKDFLVRLAAESGAERLHIIAHSMGNRGLLGAVQRIQAEAAREAGVRFGQVFLAAPDVDVDVFRELAVHYPKLADRTTLYVSRRDRAVILSRWLHGHERVGYVPPVTVVEGIDSIEVSGIDLTVLGHGYFAEAAGVLYDMYHLLRHDMAPDRRIRLRPMVTPEGSGYWAIDP
jgi:type VI secretion system ImpA family protein